MDNPTRLFDFPRYQLANGPLDVMMTMPNGGQPISYSTAEFVEEMDRVSRGLISMGLAPGDRVALISHNNRCEWNLTDHGTLQASGIDVPIYPTMTPRIMSTSSAAKAASRVSTPNSMRGPVHHGQCPPSKPSSPSSRRRTTR